MDHVNIAGLKTENPTIGVRQDLHNNFIQIGTAPEIVVKRRKNYFLPLAPGHEAKWSSSNRVPAEILIPYGLNNVFGNYPIP